MNFGIKELKDDNHVEDFLTWGYQNKWMVDLYVEHFDYDVMDFLKEEENGILSSESSDEYDFGDEGEDIDYVDFEIKGEENVAIQNLTNQDPFLHKPCSNHGIFRGFTDEPALFAKELK